MLKVGPREIRLEICVEGCVVGHTRWGITNWHLTFILFQHWECMLMVACEPGSSTTQDRLTTAWERLIAPDLVELQRSVPFGNEGKLKVPRKGESVVKTELCRQSLISATCTLLLRRCYCAYLQVRQVSEASD